jgi:hypothetical protein
MKKQFLLIALLYCGNAPLNAALEAQTAHIEITQPHLIRIIFQRGLGLSVFNSEGEGVKVFTTNVTKSVTKATKKLFAVLLTQADAATVARCLRSGADAQAQMIVTYHEKTISLTPSLIIAALTPRASEEISQEIERSNLEVTAGIEQISLNEPAVGVLFKEMMGRLAHSPASPLSLTPPESPQEISRLTQRELETLLLSLKI